MTSLRFPWVSLLLGFILAFSSSAPGQTSGFSSAEISQGFRNGRALVKLKAGVAIEPDVSRQQIEGSLGVTGRHIFEHLDRQQVLEFDSSRNVRATMKALRATGLYEFVEEDHIVHALATPNDPSFAQQWSLKNTGQVGPSDGQTGNVAGISGDDIAATSGWDTQNSAANIILAVLDSGMRMTHTDLAANLWTNTAPSSAYGTKPDLHGINAVVTPTTGDPTDDVGHGTHVSGIAGAVGNNGIGISGVAWKVQLMPLKFLDSTGAGTTSAELTCLSYAIAHHANIINGSFGASGYSSSEFAALQSVQAAGIIVVVAAGNDGVSIESDFAYPAGYLLDNIVTVAATTRTDALASYSNFSAGLADLGAPGDEIYSTYNTSDTGYTILSGTSMASPHVAGALALLKAHFPNDTYRQLINRLLRNTTPLAALSGKVQSGGELNLAAALTSTDSRPLNDDFANRAVLSGNNVVVRSSNVGATFEASEPAHAGVAASTSLWWTWTAPATGSVVTDTAGSGFDTVVGIYTGSAVNALQAVASNDNASGTVTTSRIVFNAVAGTTYQIAVAGKNGASGLLTFHLGTIPANDNFANAQVVSGISLSVTGSNVNAGAETGEPNHANTGSGNSVWYQWVAPVSGQFQISAVSLGADMVDAVYTGTSVSSLTRVASNDDTSAYDIDALSTFTAVAGQTYYFAVDTNSDTPGGSDFTLQVDDSLWQWGTGGSVTSSPAIASDGSVIVGSNDAYVYARRADGTTKWESALADVIDLCSPAIGSDGTVYIAGGSTFYALNGNTGGKKWTFSAATAVSASPAIASDGTIYFHDDSTLYALNGTTNSGTMKWSYGYNAATYCSPAVAVDGTVYVGGVGGTFYALNPDGSLKWKMTANDDIYTSPAIATDGTIYFATLSGTVYAVSPAGATLWTWTATGNSSITSSIAIGPDGSLYFGAYDNKLHALTKSGAEKWSYTMGDQVRASSSVVASDGTIYIGAYDSKVYAITSTGGLQRIFATADIIRSSPVVSNGRLYFGCSDAKLYAFTINQNLSATPWPTFHQGITRTGRATATALLTIGLSPLSQIAATGTSVTFNVLATGTAPISYQWYFNNVAIAGATSSSYSISSVANANVGNYTVIVTDASGSITSSPASLTIGTVNASDSHLYALAARATVGTGGNILIPGIAVGGTNSRSVLVRASGPALISQGVTGTLATPQLQLYQVGVTAPIAINIGWSTGGSTNTAALRAAFTQANLPTFQDNSADCALIATLSAGSAYTAQVSGVNNTTGIALIEVYELGTGNARMTALACRATVGTGANVLIPGIIITGTSPKKLIIRASGPALANLGVTGTLAQPDLQVYSGSTKIAENIGWSTGDPTIAAVASSVGLSAFQPNSADCAVVLTLPPGGYTAQVSGLNGTSGVALVEVYEVP